MLLEHLFLSLFRHRVARHKNFSKHKIQLAGFCCTTIITLGFGKELFKLSTKWLMVNKLVSGSILCVCDIITHYCESIFINDRFFENMASNLYLCSVEKFCFLYLM